MNAKHPPLAVVILAAGKGTRMNSDLPKVLHQVHGRPMLDYVLDLAGDLRAARTILVVGYGADAVQGATASRRGLRYARQEPQLGTGHAVMSAEPHLAGFGGDVLILYGDVPCLRPATVQALLEQHARESDDLTALAMEVGPDNEYGRLVLDPAGGLERIVETRDADPTQKAITLASSGIFVFRADPLRSCLPLLTTDNDQGEYYLTDLVRIFKQRGFKVGWAQVQDPEEVAGVNSAQDLRRVERTMACLSEQGGR